LFDTLGGKKSLADLFGGRSQLMTYHFMFARGTPAGRPACSFLCDHLDGTLPHLEHHDVTLLAVSRAPLSEIEVYRKRMGRGYDYHVSLTKKELAAGTASNKFTEVPARPDAKDSELPGSSAFCSKEAGEVLHTYSSYARGPEELIATLMILDPARKGRNEKRPWTVCAAMMNTPKASDSDKDFEL
jgi:predicted dithiol-disulfide oxidoreductase (DUF899 family)